MDELDRLFGLLVAALARETRVAVPFPASDVYERLVPYRSNRARLNVATHQDYEMAVLRLLAGERNYVQLEPENVREAMQREIATINPDPAYFRSFPDAQVMVNGRAAERVLLAERAYAPPSAAEEDEELLDTTGENPVPVPFVSPSAFRAHPPVSRSKDALASNQCEYCGGVLPVNREARFARIAASPAKGTCAARAAAGSWTWGGPTACRAVVRQGLNDGRTAGRPDGQNRGDCGRRDRTRSHRSGDPYSRPRRREARVLDAVGTSSVFCRSLSQDKGDAPGRRIPAPTRRRGCDLPRRVGGSARARQRACARHPLGPAVSARPVRKLSA